MDINMGSILENAVAQQLKANGFGIFYYDSSKLSCRINFCFWRIWCFIYYIVVLFLLFSIEIDKLPFLISHYKKNIWARDLTINPWFLPLEGSFIDKYKRDFKLRLNIALTDLFTKRFENTTDFIFSLSKENYNTVLEELQQYLKNININLINAIKILFNLSKFSCFWKNFSSQIKNLKIFLKNNIALAQYRVSEAASAVYFGSRFLFRAIPNALPWRACPSAAIGRAACPYPRSTR